MKIYSSCSSWATRLHLLICVGLSESLDISTSFLRKPCAESSSTEASFDMLQDSPTSAYSKINWYPCFRDLQGMTDAMFDLQKTYSKLVSVADIGDSYLKSIADPHGHDIHVMKITASAQSEPAQVLFTGGHHPREYAPPELLMRLATHLVQGYGEDAEITRILDTTQINIILYVNPDGRVIAETKRYLYWRKNMNPGDGSCDDFFIGTDLNRNYDWMWGDTSGASSNPCKEDYFGSQPASEPEVQAVIEYAKTLFPEGQRKDDPLAEIDVPFGEDITGIYMDIHSSGGYTFYPWNYADIVSPDNDSLEALGRKISYFNGYTLWAGGQPDFLYPATGVASDFMYAHLGVASLGLELGDAFYEDCDNFETKVFPHNLDALMYVIKLAKKPNSIAKGPDIFNLAVSDISSSTEMIVTAEASDSELVNIKGYPRFKTGEQSVSKVVLYLDVHPDDDGASDAMYVLQPSRKWFSEKVSVKGQISTVGLATGRHVLYAVATDGDGYAGPVSSVFFDVKNNPSPVRS